MIYILHAVFTYNFSKFFDVKKSTPGAKRLLFFFLGITLAFLPSFQYEVGTDYSSYYSIAEENTYWLFERKSEYLYFWLFYAIDYLDLGGQSFFIITSLLNSFLLVNVLAKMNSFGFRVSVLVFIFLVFSGMYQNQMNGIRTFTAVYAFLNAFMYKIDRKWFAVILFSILGVISHQSFLIVFVFLFLPSSVFLWAANYPVIIFSSSLLGYIFVMTDQAVAYLINTFLPFYSHYVGSRFSEGVSFFNIFTKLIYLPVFLIFLYGFAENKNLFCRTGKLLIGVWLFTYFMYVSFYSSGLLFRAYHYFSFFSLVPIYYVLVHSVFRVYRYPVMFYLFFLFIFKVFVFPVGEYHYKSIIGPLCEFPWSMPQC